MFLDYRKRRADLTYSIFSPLPRWAAWLSYIALGIFLLVIVSTLFLSVLWGPKSGPGDPAKWAKLDVHDIGEALAQFKTENGRYPSTSEGLDALMHKPADSNLPGWKQILNEVPLDPWGNPYIYTAPASPGQPFKILSYGPDGKPGGGDDVSN